METKNMMEGCIRPATLDDLSRIAEILVYNNRINYFPIFRDEAFSFGVMQVLKVAEGYRSDPDLLARTYVYDDGTLRGLVQLAAPDLQRIYVDPFFQSRGVGAALIEYAVQVHHCRRLWVLEKNLRARQFYARHGFAPTGERKFEEGTTEYLIRMERK